MSRITWIFRQRRLTGFTLIGVGVVFLLTCLGYPAVFGGGGPGGAVLRVTRDAGGQVAPRLPEAHAEVTGAAGLAALPSSPVELRRQASALAALETPDTAATTSTVEPSSTTGPGPTTVPPPVVTVAPPGSTTTSTTGDLGGAGDPTPEVPVPVPFCDGKLVNRLGVPTMLATGLYELTVQAAPVDQVTATVLGDVLAGDVAATRAGLIRRVYGAWPETAPGVFTVDGAHLCLGARLVEVDRLVVAPLLT